MCSGFTKDNKRCRNQTNDFSGLCHVHWSQTSGRPRPCQEDGLTVVCGSCAEEGTDRVTCLCGRYSPRGGKTAHAQLLRDAPRVFIPYIGGSVNEHGELKWRSGTVNESLYGERDMGGTVLATMSELEIRMNGMALIHSD